MNKLRATVRRPSLRCAIYTRKSSEEGLEQAFNSLHAQREACEAYIRSQRHEGWVCLAHHYDDGGLSRATMDRPALQQLLADIATGRIDLLVTYKILIGKLFDEAGCPLMPTHATKAGRRYRLA